MMLRQHAPPPAPWAMAALPAPGLRAALSRSMRHTTARRTPAAAAAATPDGGGAAASGGASAQAAAPQQRTFLHKALQTERPALLEPEDVTYEALTLLRGASPGGGAPRELSALLACALPAAADRGGGGGGGEGGGPLAECAGFMCPAARRALPGHLLRRCRVLSSVRLGGRATQRVLVTACTGEELTLAWTLVRAAAAADDGGSAAAAAAAAAAGPWRIASVARDGSDDADHLPPRPVPRAGPELVVQAQLAALRRGDVRSAAAFMVAAPGGAPEGAASPAAAAAANAAAEALRSQLRDGGLHPLLTHASAELAGAALPATRRFEQAVVLTPGGAFLWRLELDGGQCWRVASIAPAGV